MSTLRNLRSLTFLAATFLVAVVAFGACSEDDPGPDLAIGFSVVEISPTAAEIATKKIYMGAYGLPLVRYAEGIHDPIYVRAMALRSAHVGLILMVLDAPVLSEYVIRDIEKGVAAQTGIPASHVAIGATHTHSAPDLMGLWGGVLDSYRARVVELAIQVGVDAWRAKVEAVLEATTGQAANRNRRGWKITDPDLVLLRARDLESGKILGAVVNFAAHPIFLDAGNKQVTRDYCGYVVDALEKQLGAPSLYFNGIVGDASPQYAGPGKDHEAARGYGEALAAVALALPVGTEVRNELVVTEVSWQQKIENSFFMLAERGGLLDEFDVTKTKDGLLSVEINATYFRLGGAIAGKGPPSYPLQGVTFPGEALTRTGLEIKKAMTAQHKLLLGLTRATLGYFIRKDEWKTGRNDDYEESVSPGPDAGENAIEKLTGLIAADLPSR